MEENRREDKEEIKKIIREDIEKMMQMMTKLKRNWEN